MRGTRSASSLQRQSRTAPRSCKTTAFRRGLARMTMSSSTEPLAESAPPMTGLGRRSTRLLVTALVVACLSLVTARATPGAPRSPAPEPIRPGEPAPPPAWASSRAAQKWLAYFAYCWPDRETRFCTDFDGLPRETPRLVVRQGDVVRFHLGFQPASVVLEFMGAMPGNGGLTRLWQLPTRRVTSWRVRDDRGGFAQLKVRVPDEACPARGCHAIYLARFVIKPANCKRR